MKNLQINTTQDIKYTKIYGDVVNLKYDCAANLNFNGVIKIPNWEENIMNKFNSILKQLEKEGLRFHEDAWEITFNGSEEIRKAIDPNSIWFDENERIHYELLT